jgi:hypothetical protein
LPRTTVNGFDNPKFPFFERIKCHISSNSISCMSPGTSGSGKLSPNSRIQRPEKNPLPSRKAKRKGLFWRQSCHL